MDKLLTAREVAEIFGCHEQTIYKWKDQGKIPCVRKNGLIRFRKTEIEEWLDQGASKSSPLIESLTKVDLALDSYDKMFLKGVTMSQTGKTWNYPFGSVYLRQNKSGKERWYIYYRIEGKRVRKAVKGAQSRSDALKVLQVEVADAFRGKHGFRKDKERIRFNDLAEKFLEDHAKVNKTQQSWKTDEYYLKGIKKFFKNRFIDEITPHDIAKYKAKRVKDDVRPATMNRCLSVIRKMFNLAIDWGYLSESPMRNIKFFSEKDNIIERILTEAEETRLLDACADHLRPIVLTALHTGMRNGEVLSLRWQQVDFERREIRVENTKSKKIRFIPMNDDLFRELARLQLSRDNSTEHVFIYPPIGKPMKRVTRSFQQAVEDAGIKGLRFHDLRHTFATRLIERGVDLITVKELLGHHSVEVTQRYTHSFSEQKQRAVAKLTRNPRESVHISSTFSEPGFPMHLFSVN